VVRRGGLLGGNDFSVFAGELFLALLLDADSVPYSEIKVTVGQAVAEEGFRESRTGERPDEQDIGWAVHATSNMCRALGLMVTGSDWLDRSYGLTGTGKATALQALRARACGVPELAHWPWPGLLRGSLVFVDEAAEDWAALDPLLGEVGDGFVGPERAAAMGLSVVVPAYSARTDHRWR
jgi:hypothetical protein